jgi:O-antigen/teichoic acid export membrane protein
MESSQSNTKRIAKNTLLLYFRMILTMLVSLITVRVVLNTLGVVDYGIYNVVGGIVVMFSFISNTMAAASQRFFAFDLGKNDFVHLKQTFSMSVIINVIIGGIILILAESIGLYFLNHKLNIPANRLITANWIYQFSILSFIITIMTTPFNAIIIAREKMGVYAYVSIIEVVSKLLFVYLLVIFSTDKLKLYAFFMLLNTLLISCIYIFYCKQKYDETKYEYVWNKELFKILINYSGWNLFGAIAYVFNSQGINILLNIFFGPVVNASRGIAFMINASINQFVNNFTTALNPQITKYFAAGENVQMLNLVFKSSKWSYFLLFFLSMPILIETNFILVLWLKQVPEYVVLFTRLVIMSAIIDTLSNSLITTALATGKIKKYQIIVGSTLLLNLPISYLFLKLGFQPQITMIVSIFISLTCLFLRLWMLSSMVGLSINKYFKDVIFVILMVSVIAYALPLISYYSMHEGIYRLVSICLISVISSLLSIYIIGLTHSERNFIRNFIHERIKLAKR